MDIEISHTFSPEERNSLNQILMIEVQDWLDSEIDLKSGRGKIKKLSFAGKSLIMRKYFRGGLIRRFNKDYFLNLPFIMTRPKREFEILNKLQQIGLPVPKPIAYIVKEISALRYQGFIITEEIEFSRNFLDSLDNETTENVKSISKQAGSICHQILLSNVFHPDLHLGNILVKDDYSVFIIDFDKAYTFSSRRRKLFALKIIKRWLHSCSRHHINKIAYHPFCEGLDIDSL